MNWYKKANENFYNISEAVLGTLSGIKPEEKFNLERIKNLPDDKWIAIVETRNPLTKKEVEEFRKMSNLDPDGKNVPYFFIVTDSKTNEQWVVFTDEKTWYPLSTNEEKEKATKVGIEKGLKKEHVKF